MKQEDVFSLGEAMNELSKYAAPKLRFIIKRGKSVGVESRWVIFDNQYKEWVLADKNYMSLKDIATEWNEQEAQQSKANLRCITGRGLEAVDLMNYRVSKRLISKRSSAKLKLVGQFGEQCINKKEI